MNIKRMIIILSALLTLLLIGSVSVIFFMNHNKSKNQNRLSAKAESEIQTFFEKDSEENSQEPEESSTDIQNETMPDTTDPPKSIESMADAATTGSEMTESANTVTKETIIANVVKSIYTDSSNDSTVSSVQVNAASTKESAEKKSSEVSRDMTDVSKDTDNKTGAGTPTVPSRNQPAESTAKTSVSNDSSTTTPADSKPKTNSDSIRQTEGSKTGGSQSQTTEVPTKTEKTTEPKAEITPECNHTWVWATKTETIHHDAVIKEGYWHVIAEAYEKPISVEKIKCGHCKKLYDDYDDYRLHDDCYGSYGWVTVDSGRTVHVDEEKEWIEPEIIQEAYDETVTVNDYQYCSKCKNRK